MTLEERIKYWRELNENGEVDPDDVAFILDYLEDYMKRCELLAEKLEGVRENYRSYTRRFAGGCVMRRTSTETDKKECNHVRYDVTKFGDERPTWVCIECGKYGFYNTEDPGPFEYRFKLEVE